jgi:porphobilinogen synthase
MVKFYCNKGVMMFRRMRRIRTDQNIRDILQEIKLSCDDFVYPLFVVEGSGVKKEVSSLPGVFQMSIDEIVKECDEVISLGIKSIMLFGIPSLKDSVGSVALDEEAIVARATKEIKKAHGDRLYIMADLCFCEYTDHGHCGILDHKTQSVDNDSTLEILGEQAVVLASAGIDMVAPSGMMDGMVSAIREALDANGFINLPIMSYSTKFASAYYGPFRDVAESAPAFGDRRTYQQNPANRNEAIRESLNDEEEGADILMVKPALAYLDVVRDIKERTLLPLAVYNVSGEYAMLKAAGKAGVIEYERVMMETMLGFKRAGADIIISYHAKEVCKILKEG